MTFLSIQEKKRKECN